MVVFFRRFEIRWRFQIMHKRYFVFGFRVFGFQWFQVVCGFQKYRIRARIIRVRIQFGRSLLLYGFRGWLDSFGWEAFVTALRTFLRVNQFQGSALGARKCKLYRGLE
jgi:hypothetical protein